MKKSREMLKQMRKKSNSAVQSKEVGKRRFVQELSIRIFLFSLFLLFLLIITIPSTSSAFSSESESYDIGWGTFNDFSDRKGSENFDMVDTGGQIGIDVYESESFKVMAGFEYYYSLIPFTFTISNNQVDFGTLSPSIPVTRSTDLTVSSGAAHGYEVSTEEDHQLEHLTNSGVFINDTIGDNSDITESSSGIWEFSSTPGFGYTLDNIIGTDAVFTTGYKQFADISNLEEPQIIMRNSGVTRESIVRVIYKVNIEGSQQAGTYRNNIKYICTGTF